MKITTIKENNIEIAVISSSEILVIDVQSALDLIYEGRYGIVRMMELIRGH